MDRVFVLFLAAALMAGPALPRALAGDTGKPLAPADDPDGVIAFTVMRKGEDIGTHRIAFFERGNGLDVHITIDLKVKFAFITLFSYTHRSVETWRGGELVAIETRTKTKGKRYTVSGRRIESGFEVTDAEGRTYVIDRSFLPSSYWHPATPQQTALLNTQTGALASVTVAPARVALADNGPAAAPPQTYRISGDVRLTLAYTRGVCLTDLAFTAPGDGTTIAYQRRSHLWNDGRIGLAGHPLLGPCTEVDDERAGGPLPLTAGGR